VWLQRPKDAFVRVPDRILKAAVFLGLDQPLGREYGGTGYIVAVEYTSRYPFMFLVTAAHVAEELEGRDFYVRSNYKDGSLAELKQDSENTKWWYHSNEKETVDAAAMLLPIKSILDLDIEPIPIGDFVSEETIQTGNLGIGDEVFVAGLFRKAQGTLRNIPIIRIGNVAMMPKEKIPFPTVERPNQWLYADLLEVRSIGGLSGSPVFIRETLKLAVYSDSSGTISSGEILMVNGVPMTDVTWEGEMQGLGKFHFFGSMIGQWRVNIEFSNTKEEAVNLGIAPMVPAQKILEVLSQPELMETMGKMSVDIDEQRKRKDGIAVMDSGFSAGKREKQGPTQMTAEGLKIAIPERDEFFDALKKASRKIKPKS
jgi:hypothetical protein